MVRLLSLNSLFQILLLLMLRCLIYKQYNLEIRLATVWYPQDKIVICVMLNAVDHEYVKVYTFFALLWSVWLW